MINPEKFYSDMMISERKVKFLVIFYTFYMNLTSKTPSNVWISIKGNFPIKTSEVLAISVS